MFRLFRLCTSNIDRSNKSKWLCMKKPRIRQYPAETITDADYAGNLTLLANKATLAKSLLHSLTQAAGGNGLYVNANKTELVCFKQEGAISTLSGEPLEIHIPCLQYLIN